MTEQNQARKQLLKELIETQNALEKGLETQDEMIKRFQALSADGDLFVQIIDHFPYAIAVFAKDGMLEVANDALLAAIGIEDAKLAINKFNIFAHSLHVEMIKVIKRVLTGETVFLYGMKDALKTFDKIPKKTKPCAEAAQDIICFPITGEGGAVSHAVAVLIGCADQANA